MRDAGRYGLRGSYPFFGHVLAGRHCYWDGQLQRSFFLLQRALDLASSAGTRVGVARAHAYLGDLLLVQEQPDAALQAYQRGQLVASASGHRDVYAQAHCAIGIAHARSYGACQLQHVQGLMARSLALYQRSGSEVGYLQALERAAEVCRRLDAALLARKYQQRRSQRLHALGLESLHWRPPAARSGAAASSTSKRHPLHGK